MNTLRRMSTTISESSFLWQKFCGGDKEALGRLAEENYLALYHYGTKFTTDKDQIKDCLQDLFLDLWEKRSVLTEVVAVKPYLFQALRNNLIRKVRRQTVFSELNDDQHSTDFTPESAWILSETDQLMLHRLTQSIELLPKRQREALYLRYYENLSYEEIGEVMGLQRQAVANYLQYGIQKLREYWQHSVISLLLSSLFTL
jgi:RNA polymerase sigma factor (sigma-70 family)